MYVGDAAALLGAAANGASLSIGRLLLLAPRAGLHLQLRGHRWAVCLVTFSFARATAGWETPLWGRWVIVHMATMRQLLHSEWNPSAAAAAISSILWVQLAQVHAHNGCFSLRPCLWRSGEVPPHK
jgi:hypothetical protein